MDKWGSLSQKEKSDLMKLAIQNNVYDLSEIKKMYNGLVSSAKEKVTGAVDEVKDVVRKRLYENLVPGSYDDYAKRLFNTVVLNNPDTYQHTKLSNEKIREFRDNIFAEYLQIPEEERRGIKSFPVVSSKYRPVVGAEDVPYKTVKFWEGNTEEEDKNDLRPLIWDRVYKDVSSSNLQLGENKVSKSLNYLFNDHTVGRGYDENGEYISYADTWDIAPISKKGKDESLGIGKPVHFYDRMYLDDYFNVPNDKAHYLRQVEVTPSNSYANGGYTEDDDLLDFVIKEEGFLNKPTDIGDGKMTLGSGLTDPKWHELYKKRGNKWSKEDNRMAVAEELTKRRRWAEKNVPNWGKLPDSSQKALLSYKYNYDFNADNSPKMYEALKDFDLRRAAKEINATSKNPIFKKGLTKRRGKEESWFNEGVEELLGPSESIFPEITKPEVSHVINMPDATYSPTSTAVYNPYTYKKENTYFVPTQVPDENKYVSTHPLTPEEYHNDKVVDYYRSLDEYNRLMKMIDIKNSFAPTYTSEDGFDYFKNLLDFI